MRVARQPSCPGATTTLAGFEAAGVGLSFGVLSQFSPSSWLSLMVVAGYPSGLTGVDLLSRPVPGHQLVDMGHFVICDTGQNPTKPRLGIDTVHAAGFNERIGDCCGVTAAL